MRIDQLAEAVGARLYWPDEKAVNPSLEISRMAPITSAKTGDITFVTTAEYAKKLSSTQASAVILAAENPQCPLPQLIHKSPHVAFAKVAQIFESRRPPVQGVHPQAVVHPAARIGQNVSIGPFCHVAADVVIGDRVVLHAGAVVGPGVTIGDDTEIRANTVIEYDCKIGARVLIHAGSVIGADGFGFAVDEGRIIKIPQVGIVRIEDDVEVGACCTIDRAAMGETLISAGTKLDSKVHIGHGALIGRNCMFSAHTAVAGSATVGDWVLAGGHSGIAGHLTVGNGVKIGAMTGVIKDADAGETYLGFPAIPGSEWRRQQVYLRKLPELEKRLKELERRLMTSPEA